MDHPAVDVCGLPAWPPFGHEFRRAAAGRARHPQKRMDGARGSQLGHSFGRGRGTRRELCNGAARKIGQVASPESPRWPMPQGILHGIMIPEAVCGPRRTGAQKMWAQGAGRERSGRAIGRR
jgi:hypothetical protein